MKYVINGYARTSSWAGCGRTVKRTYSGKSVFDALMELYNASENYQNSSVFNDAQKHFNIYSDNTIYAAIGFESPYVVTDIKVYSDSDELIGYCYRNVSDRVESIGQKCHDEFVRFRNWQKDTEKRLEAKFVDL